MKAEECVSMYNNKRIIGLITARGGSKGIPGKNVKELNGKPLIAYTIEAARSSKYIDSVVITTDDEEIAAVSKAYGAEVPFRRPPELASDTSKSVDAVMHAVNYFKGKNEQYDALILLQPTSPLRTAEDIDGAIETYYKNGEEGLVSVSPVEDHPLLVRSIGADGILEKLLDVPSTCRRQDMPAYYRVNGAIYIYNFNGLSLETSFNDGRIPYIMKKENAIDIDAISDFWYAECFLKNE